MILMNRKITYYLCFLAGVLLSACQNKPENAALVDTYPAIFPDYTEVTIPVEIAPLNFAMQEPVERLFAVLEGDNGGRIEVTGREYVDIPINKWKELLSGNKKGNLKVTVSARKDGKWQQYRPFPIHISEYPMDYGLVYRLIAPGYEVYSHMGVYQRNLSDFTQTALIENTLISASCVNCHSFLQADPENLSLHIRGQHGGTLLKTNGKTDILDLKTTEAVGRGVYPYWHPSGNYIAYSMNDTRQVFHSAAGKRIEVFDLSSNLTVYDVRNNRVLTTPLLMTDDFETFPAFSADGQSLYFCLSDRRNLPDAYEDVRYNLCRIAFDPQTGAFGNEIDTLVYAAEMLKSVSFPRPSYDGRYIMYTLSDYGNFSIWHKEADLWLLDLQTGETRALEKANSHDTESYHSWSSNSRWFVFSSRRQDGLYTRPYIASIGEDGQESKPFLLPQKKPSYYQTSLYSFNIPEFVAAPVELDIRDAERKIRSGERLRMKE